MSLRRMFLELVICVAVILSEMGAAAVDKFQIAKPNCQDMCGDVPVPYPFGTTEDCSLNGDFFLICKDKSGHPPELIAGRNLPVTSISMDGELDIMMFISHECFESGKPVVPTNNPSIKYPAFTISNTKNKFVTIGCDTYAYLNAFRNNEGFSIGCMSICKSLINIEDGSCNGIGCCQVDIPTGLKNFTLNAGSYYKHIYVSDFNPCSFAFVAKEDNKFNFSSDHLTSLRERATYPMVLDWAIGDEKCETAQNKPADYVCGGNSSCEDPPEGVDGYRCKCKEGYEGNPYLPDGCQDINECEAYLNPCDITTSRCNNIDGDFKCTCLDGYEDDGKIINGKGCRLKAGANRSKINIIIPLAVGIGLIGLFMGGSSIYCGLQRRKFIKLKEKFFQQNGGSLLQEKLSNYRASTEVAKIFSVEELEKATNNFDKSKILGEGGYGTVYRGVLLDNKIVAIKKSKICDKTQIEQFINEVIVLTQINHRNVVRMLGCCLETEVPLLVYEFITNGTLSSHIHDRNLSSSLSWEKRLKIASETAGALAYLHSSTSVPILHRDVKTANILLDENYSAKVADFGTSILAPLDQTELSTLVKGTFGYLDPEYFYSNQLTEKSDVYSFGVVVAELLTGKKALSFDRPEKDRSLAMYFNSAVKEDRLHQILDDHIVNDGNINVIDEVANIAKSCLSVRGEDRPTMKEVAMELEGLRIMGKHPWVKADLYTEETEYLLGAPTHSFNIDVYNGSSSTITIDVGLESMRNQVVKPLDDGR